MARQWSPDAFESAYRKEFVSHQGYPFGTPDYYSRYESRYRILLERFSALAPQVPVDVLDFGGGQLALLCQLLWKDRAAVADLPGQPQLEYMSRRGVVPVPWNLCADEQPCTRRFDYVFFSEVIEHLPIPGHVALERIRHVLKPGGTLICSTPNLYRMRNVIHLAFGLPIFDNIQTPGADSLGHVIEYSRDGLRWQLDRAGFDPCTVELRQFHHNPINPLARLLSWLGYPLFVVPRWRDNLIAIARSPERA